MSNDNMTIIGCPWCGSVFGAKCWYTEKCGLKHMKCNQCNKEWQE